MVAEPSSESDEPTAGQRAINNEWDSGLPFGDDEEAVSDFIQNLEVVVVTRYPDGLVVTDDSDLDDETIVYLLDRAKFLIQQRTSHLLKGMDEEDDYEDSDEDEDEEEGPGDEASV